MFFILNTIYFANILFNKFVFTKELSVQTRFQGRELNYLESSSQSISLQECQKREIRNGKGSDLERWWWLFKMKKIKKWFVLIWARFSGDRWRQMVRGGIPRGCVRRHDELEHDSKRHVSRVVRDKQ